MFAVAKCPGNNNRSILRFDGVIPVRVEIIEVVNRPWSLVKRWSFLWQSALCQQQQRYNNAPPKNDLHPIAGVGFMLGVRAPRRGPLFAERGDPAQLLLVSLSKLTLPFDAFCTNSASEFHGSTEGYDACLGARRAEAPLGPPDAEAKTATICIATFSNSAPLPSLIWIVATTPIIRISPCFGHGDADLAAPDDRERDRIQNGRLCWLL